MTALDRRMASTQAALAFRGRLEQDLGGSGNMSEQLKTAAELLTREVIYLDHYDAHLLGHQTVLTKNRRSMVRERGAIVDRIARLLSLVGLDRRAQDVRSSAERLSDTVEAEEASAAAQEPAVDVQDAEPDAQQPEADRGDERAGDEQEPDDAA